MFRFSPFFLWPLALWLLLQLFCSPAHAQSPYGYPFTITGNTIEYFSADIRFAESFRPTASLNAGGLVVVDSSSSIGLGSGRNLPLTLRTVPTGPSTAKAISNFARGVGGAALKAAGYVYAAAEVGKALWDLCNDLGYRCSKGEDGNPVVEKSDPLVCSVSPCYEYQAELIGGGAYTEFFSTPQQAAQNAVEIGYSNTYWRYTLVSQTVNNYTYNTVNKTTGNDIGNSTRLLSRRSVAPKPATYVPSSLTELENAIAAKSGWPSGSSVAKVLNQAMQSGEPLTVPAPSTITGPTTVQGPKTTTTTPAQNGNPAKTVTTSTVTNVTYEGPKVITNNVTTTVTNTTINNVPQTTTETEESEPEVAPADSANPDLPKLYERKYPDGLTGVWTTRKAELAATPLRNLIGSLTPTIVSSNGCPQFSIPLNLGRWNWGTYALGPPCMVWDFLKVCVLLCAGFLVRAIVFGG